VQQAIEGYKQFEALTAQYAEEMISQTRAAIAAGSKKKPSHPHSSSPKNKRSSKS